MTEQEAVDLIAQIIWDNQEKQQPEPFRIDWKGVSGPMRDDILTTAKAIRTQLIGKGFAQPAQPLYCDGYC